jgi:hypothetical protein
MVGGKQYAGPEFYERKLETVMGRLGVEKFNYNWDRRGCFVEFWYKGNIHRMEHSVEKGAAKGQKLKYGSDAFAQVVLSLEDLARMVERGIYDLSVYIEGMKFLQPPVIMPKYFRVMGFTSMPADAAEVNDRYRTLAKQWHPDNKETGNEELFKALQQARDPAIKHFKN